MVLNILFYKNSWFIYVILTYKKITNINTCTKCIKLIEKIRTNSDILYLKYDNEKLLFYKKKIIK
jgi:hypothetical protein